MRQHMPLLTGMNVMQKGRHFWMMSGVILALAQLTTSILPQGADPAVGLGPALGRLGDTGENLEQHGLARPVAARACPESARVGELVFCSGQAHHDVLLLRLHKESAANRVRVVKVVLDQYVDRLASSFTVATQDGVRIQPMS
jgi:hypothetical protein